MHQLPPNNLPDIPSRRWSTDQYGQGGYQIQANIHNSRFSSWELYTQWDQFNAQKPVEFDWHIHNHPQSEKSEAQTSNTLCDSTFVGDIFTSSCHS